MSNFEGTPPFYIRIRSCHGNHVFSHSPDRFIFRGTLFHIFGVLLNNMVPMKNVLVVQDKLNLPPDYIVL